MKRMALVFSVLSSVLIVGAPSIWAESLELNIAQLETKKDTASSGGGSFHDDFDGAKLSDIWNVVNPRPDNFVVQDGQLLVVSGEVGNLKDNSFPNLFETTHAAPDGDWTANISLNIDVQTGKEGFILALHEDGDNYLGVGIYTSTSCCKYARLHAMVFKRTKGEPANFNRLIWENTGNPDAPFSEIAVGMPTRFTLRIEKKGPKFLPSIKLENGSNVGWIEMEKLVMLRAKGHFVFGVYQYEDTKGETIAGIDSFSVASSP